MRIKLNYEVGNLEYRIGKVFLFDRLKDSTLAEETHGVIVCQEIEMPLWHLKIIFTSFVKMKSKCDCCKMNPRLCDPLVKS